MSEIYDFTSYRAFLKIAFPGKGDGRGNRRALAKALGCQTSFISLVLTERAHLNEDMAFQVAQFLRLGAAETSFFLLLYHHERAGSSQLRKYYQKQIDDVRAKRSDVKERVGAEPVLTSEIQIQYYSDWAFSAIHTAVMNPETRTTDAIAAKLNLPGPLIDDKLRLLESWNLIARVGKVAQPTLRRIHLGADSVLISQHHRNWHLEAMRSHTKKHPMDLNYSGALSMSKEDVDRVRKIFLNAIEKTEKLIGPSPDEELMGFAVSLFQY